MLLIKNGTIVTVDSHNRVMEDGAVLIDSDRIVKVGKTHDVVRDYSRGDDIIDASNHIVIPGLVNVHNHIFQVLMRGLGDDLPLSRFVNEVIFPLSRKLGKKESVAAGLLASVEMVRSGTTCVRDCHYVHADKLSIEGVAEALSRSGIRAVIGRASVDSELVPKELREDVKTMRREFARFANKWHGKANGRIRVRPEALNEFHSSQDMIAAVRELATKFGTGMNMHVAEGFQRMQSIRERYGRGTIEYLNDLGVLGPDVLLDHCVWVTDREIEIMKRTNTKVGHQPVSNQFLGDGVAPIRKMLDRGLTIGIGTDGAATNNNLDMFQVMKICALQMKVNALDPTVISAEKILGIATIGAARALGLSGEIGSLEVGKKADVVLVDLKKPEMTPRLRPVSNLVYSATGGTVSTVIIDGEVVMLNGNLMHLPQEDIIEDAERQARALMQSSALSSSSSPSTRKRRRFNRPK